MTGMERSAPRWFNWEALLLVLAIMGVMVASVGPQTVVIRASTPTAVPSRPQSATEATEDSTGLVSSVRPQVRAHIAPPLGAAAAAVMRAGCVRRALGLAGYYDVDGADSLAVMVADSFGVESTLSDRPDSLVFEGTVVGPDGALWLWHCAAAATWDTTRLGELRSDRDQPWPGLPHTFEVARGLTDAAAKECVNRAFKRFPEYDIRTQRRTRRGDTLVVSGEAFPIFDDIVRSYRCKAAIRGGIVVSMSLEETK